MTDFDIQPLANALMRAVVATGAVTRDNLDAAVAAMRDELKAFFYGDRYADARDCLQRRAVHQGYVIGLIAGNVVGRLRA